MQIGGQEITLGPFKLDRHSRQLTRDKSPVALGSRALDVLCVLADEVGSVVSKDDLLRKVWQGLIVEENNLQVQISALRKVLGDGWITTVPGRGYRLSVAGEAVTAAVPNELTGQPSLAVLPFMNLSGDVEQEFVADGIAEEIITSLSRIRSFFVIARNSSFTYKGRAVDVRQIGRDLGVRYVVEGGIRRDGRRIRVTAQLIDAETGRHIWADRYDRDFADIFAVQDEISQAMVEALAPAISQAERQRAMKRPPENLGAWEAYQRALWHWARQSDGSFTTARTLLEKAATLDSRFGQPHAWLAWIYLSEATLGVGLSLQEGFKRAEAEARTAVRLDPDNGMNHAMLAWVLDHQGRMEPALEEAELAVGLNGNDPSAQMALGRILTFTGRVAEGRAPLKAALRLDPYGPTAPSVMHHLGLGSYFEHDYRSALIDTQRAIKDFPGFVRPYPVRAAALGQIGQTSEALIALDAAIAASSTYFATLTSSRLPYYRPQDHEHLLDGLRKAGWKG